jgi:hypothetical protein
MLSYKGTLAAGEIRVSGDGMPFEFVLRKAK